MALKEIVQAVESILEDLDYIRTDEVFTFDAVPSSILDRSFRVETELGSNQYNSGDEANRIERLSLYVAFKSFRSPRTARDRALDAREAIEKEIYSNADLQALASDPIFFQDGEAQISPLVGNFIILRLVFSVNFLDSMA